MVLAYTLPQDSVLMVLITSNQGGLVRYVPHNVHSSHKELFTPGQERCGAKPSRAQVRYSSSEKCLLNLVTSGGV